MLSTVVSPVSLSLKLNPLFCQSIDINMCGVINYIIHYTVLCVQWSGNLLIYDRLCHVLKSKHTESERATLRAEYIGRTAAFVVNNMQGNG